MAVSKTFSVEAVREAHTAGVRVFGENRVQEFAGKVEGLRDLDGAEWHLIGHLQSNKAARAAELFAAVDSVDSVKLAERLNAAVQTLGKILPVLIEINVGGEEAKSGVAMGSGELGKILIGVEDWKNLSVRGLMTVPPYIADAEGSRPYFQRLREIRDKISARRVPGVSMDVLSMGMSHDFEVAIEEGSTCVRVGTAIFGGRQKR
jgi:pyridoxal phosphate enzyme (YggS family)